MTTILIRTVKDGSGRVPKGERPYGDHPNGDQNDDRNEESNSDWLARHLADMIPRAGFRRD